jgi:hypothetical protein
MFDLSYTLDMLIWSFLFAILKFLILYGAVLLPMAMTTKKRAIQTRNPAPFYRNLVIFTIIHLVIVVSFFAYFYVATWGNLPNAWLLGTAISNGILTLLLAILIIHYILVIKKCPQIANEQLGKTKL